MIMHSKLICSPSPARTAQAEALKLNRPLLSVGTPGRLAEMSRMGVLQTHSTRILVLDEVCCLGSPCIVWSPLRLSDLVTGWVPSQLLSP